jgi:hypothetical protein
MMTDVKSEIKSTLLVALLGSLALLPACTPKIYVIDRQTVLEEEAAGHWPQFEKDLVTKARAEGPTPLLKTPFNTRREKLLNVLNGELASSAAE